MKIIFCAADFEVEYVLKMHNFKKIYSEPFEVYKNNSAILILKSQDRKTAHKSSKLLKIGMLIAFVAFIFGSF